MTTTAPIIRPLIVYILSAPKRLSPVGAFVAYGDNLPRVGIHDGDEFFNGEITRSSQLRRQRLGIGRQHLQGHDRGHSCANCDCEIAWSKRVGRFVGDNLAERVLLRQSTTSKRVLTTGRAPLPRLKLKQSTRQRTHSSKQSLSSARARSADGMVNDRPATD